MHLFSKKSANRCECLIQRSSVNLQNASSKVGTSVSSPHKALRDSKMSICRLLGPNRSTQSERKNARICRKRAGLTPETAAAIFKQRGVRQDLGQKLLETTMHTHTGRRVLVSRLFGISPKAVRDIWNQRTWRHVTSTLQLVVGRSCEGDQATLREPTNQQLLVAASFIARPVGRPRGSKDSRPRRRRVVDQAAAADASAHSAAVPQPLCQPLSLADALSLDCVSFPSPSGGHGLAGERIWCAEPAESCGSPAGGPPSAAGCRFWSPAGASAAAAEDDEPELRRTYPFFLQDALL